MFGLTPFTLAPSLVRPQKKVYGPILIYGAGSTGRDVYQSLIQEGIEVIGFIDQSANVRSEYLNTKIYTLEHAAQLFDHQITVFLAIHNRDVNMPKLIAEIHQMGFTNLMNMFDYVYLFPNDQKFRYFLGNTKKIIDDKEEIIQFFNLLEDESSRQTFQQLIDFRISGEYAKCALPNFDRQYAPLDIPSWPNTLRFIDCGAYNGDTLKLFQQYGYTLDHAVVFEPDLNNYHALIKNTIGISGVFLPCGVAETAKIVRFDSGSGEGSRESEQGGSIVQMLSIDEAFFHFSPNLIKMDIEGGEFEALCGAKRTISKYRPGLAISAYHMWNDLWRLGLLIESFDLDYSFYIRSHSYSSFDTVLYAIAN